MKRGEPSLPWSLLDAAFPCHFVVDQALRVVRAGKVLQRVTPVRIGSFLGDVVRVRRPKAPLAFDALRASASSLVVLDVEGADLALRGQFVDLSADGLLVFVGAPWITEPDQLEKVGLTIGDFAVHDPIVDRMHAAEASRATSESALAVRLEAQREQLRTATARYQENELRLEHAVAQLADAKNRAEDAARVKSAFLATMSHELRTPMNAVIGMTSLLLETSLTAEQRDFAETIRGSGEALLGVINDILDFSKIESGRLELERVTFDVRASVEESLDLVSTVASAKRLDLGYAVDDDVPGEVIGDVARIRQVLLNLLSNATKFTAEGHVALTVTRAATDAAGHVRVRFAVEDTGIGIPADRVDQMFDAFSQADPSTARQFGGTGLGLAISRRLVELMGGAIGVSSRVGVGSTFWFEIPLEPVASPPLDAPLADRRVCIVEPNALHARTLAGIVRRLGATVVAKPDDDADVIVTGVGFERSAPDFTPRVPFPESVPVVLGLPLGATEPPGSAASFTKPIKTAQVRRAVLAALGVAEERRSIVVAAPGPAKSPLRILLAEDNAVNQKVALRMLERLGYTADAVADGVEAIDALQRRPYDVVLMDLYMPRMDGLEATRRIRTELGDARIRIVAMTANALQGDRERCLAAGMNGYVAKPVKLAELAASLDGTPVRRDSRGVPRGLLDHARLEDLGLARADLADIVDTYVVDARARLVALGDAAAQSNVQRVLHILHTLKGSSANIGAAALAERFRVLEARGGTDLDADELGAIARDVDRTADALRAYVDAQPA